MPDQDRTPSLDRPGVVALIGAVAVVLAAVISGVFLLSSVGDEQPANTSSSGEGSRAQATTRPPPPVTPPSSEPGARGHASSDVISRTLSMPLPDEGTVGLFLDEGRVSTECCSANFNIMSDRSPPAVRSLCQMMGCLTARPSNRRLLAVRIARRP